MSMIKGFPIQYMAQVISQTLFMEKTKNKNLFGGDSEVKVFASFEQLKTAEEVDRYVGTQRKVSNQQNRTDLIMNGVITTSENPTITNLNKGCIIPMSFSCGFRVRLGDKGNAIETINNMISKLKGRKRDIARFEDGTILVVGTLGNSYENEGLVVRGGDFLGTYVEEHDIDNQMKNTILPNLTSIGFDTTKFQWCYLKGAENGYMAVVRKRKVGLEEIWEIIENDNSNKEIIFPPVDQTFEQYKVSLSFDSIRLDEPTNLNGKEYCVLSFGGSATLCNGTAKLGNDLVKVGIKRTTIKADTDITITEDYHWLEPLDMPSGNSADTQMNQLISSAFISKSHTDSITLSLEYTFVVDESDTLIAQWFDYARYGVQANGTTITYTQGITPNMIYKVREVWSSWGNVKIVEMNTKLGESLDIENTESDILSIKVPMQIQGD